MDITSERTPKSSHRLQRGRIYNVAGLTTRKTLIDAVVAHPVFDEIAKFWEGWAPGAPRTR